MRTVLSLCNRMAAIAWRWGFLGLLLLFIITPIPVRGLQMQEVQVPTRVRTYYGTEDSINFFPSNRQVRKKISYIIISNK